MKALFLQRYVNLKTKFRKHRLDQPTHDEKEKDNIRKRLVLMRINAVRK